MGQFVVVPTADPDVLATKIAGEGITVVAGTPGLISADGRDEPPKTAGVYTAGIFAGGLSTGIGIDEGIILATGHVGNALGPNTLDNTLHADETFIQYLGCDPDLEELLTGTASCGPNLDDNVTKEATVLELQFESNSGNVSFNFVFASDEYNEYAYTNVNDVFGLFVDGENVALIPGTSTYVSIDTVNGGGGCFDQLPCPAASYPEFFNDNDFIVDGVVVRNPPFNIEYDGFTHVLTATKLGIGAGTHTLKLAISDAGDKFVDSAVFIEAGSLTDEPRAETLICNCSTPTLFDPPADRDITVKKGNRVIPLKFELCDQDGFPVTNMDISGLIAEVDYTGPAGELDFLEEDFLSAGHGEDTNVFSWVGDHWQLNLDTKMFEGSGVYMITVVSTDPDYVIDPTCSLRFEIPE
jgi:hypothetical protein